MKAIKPRNFIVFALAILSGAALLHTSQNVQQAETRLRDLESSVQREEERVRLLRAEWENLNRPERLERLAKEFLDLAPPSPETLVSGAYAIPSAPEELPVTLMNEEGAGEQALQDVSYEATGSAAEEKSTKMEAPAPALEVQPEKTFGDLLGELSGEKTE